MKIGATRSRGEIVTTSGEKISEHEGIHSFTVGQRRGLNIGGTAEPLYVVEIDAQSNRVVVGGREELKRAGFRIGEMHWVSPDLISQVALGEFPFEKDIIVQVRSRHRGVRATFVAESATSARIAWQDDWATASPGQAAVIYDLQNEELLAGGRITL